MDFNSHMRNTPYLDKSADVRMMYFSENDFPVAEFHRLRLGPVILGDELEYYRGVGLLEEVRATCEITELSADDSRFLIHNTFCREDGKLVAASAAKAAGSISSRENWSPRQRVFSPPCIHRAPTTSRKFPPA